VLVSSLAHGRTDAVGADWINRNIGEEDEPAGEQEPQPEPQRS
jgi:hypothetical protein